MFGHRTIQPDSAPPIAAKGPPPQIATALHCVICRVRRPQWSMTKSDQGSTQRPHIFSPLHSRIHFTRLQIASKMASTPSNARLDVVVFQCPPSLRILGQLQPRLPTPSHEIDQGVLPTRDWSSCRSETANWLPTQQPTGPACIPAPCNMASPSPLSPPLLLDPVNQLSPLNVLIYHPSRPPHPPHPSLENAKWRDANCVQKGTRNTKREIFMFPNFCLFFSTFVSRFVRAVLSLVDRLKRNFFLHFHCATPRAHGSPLPQTQWPAWRAAHSCLLPSS